MTDAWQQFIAAILAMDPIIISSIMTVVGMSFTVWISARMTGKAIRSERANVMYQTDADMRHEYVRRLGDAILEFVSATDPVIPSASNAIDRQITDSVNRIALLVDKNSRQPHLDFMDAVGKMMYLRSTGEQDEDALIAAHADVIQFGRALLDDELSNRQLGPGSTPTPS